MGNYHPENCGLTTELCAQDAVAFNETTHNRRSPCDMGQPLASGNRMVDPIGELISKLPFPSPSKRTANTGRHAMVYDHRLPIRASH